MLRQATIGINVYAIELCVVMFIYMVIANRNKKSALSECFCGLCLGTIGMALFGILYIWFINGEYGEAPFWQWMGIAMHLVFVNVSMYFFLACILAYVDPEQKSVIKHKIYMWGAFVVLAVGCVFSLGSYNNRIFFYIESNIFRRGSAYFLLMLPPALIVLFGILVLLKHIKNYNKREKMAFILYIGIPLIESRIQDVYKDFYWFAGAMTLSLVIILLILQTDMTQELQTETEEKDIFLENMSSEIRTPINSVIGYDEMILRECEQEEIKKYAMDVRTSANSLLNIINDILDLSKIESGQLEILKDYYDFGAMIGDISNMFQLRGEEKGLKFETKIDPGIPCTLCGDEVRLRQILINLLSNAVKYTQKGTFGLKADCEKNGTTARIRFTVQDTGMGIKKEDMSKLFEKFQRIEEQRNRNIEGTGLGMSIVANLLQLMESKLEVQSVYGQGSTFSFVVEQEIVDPKPIGDYEERNRKHSADYSYNAMFTAPNASILVVDDNEMNRKMLRELLKETQVQVFDVESGRDCLEIAEERHFDLIFMDYMMPEMDGIETFHCLQEKGVLQKTKVVMLTANALMGSKEKYLLEGFDDVLTKPVQPERLEQMVLKHLPQFLIESRVIEKEAKREKEKEDILEIEEFDTVYVKELAENGSLYRQKLREFYYDTEHIMKHLEAQEEELQDKKKLMEYVGELKKLEEKANEVGALILSKLVYVIKQSVLHQNWEQVSRLQSILKEEVELHRERVEKRLLETMDEGKR